MYLKAKYNMVKRIMPFKFLTYVWDEASLK